MKRQIKILTFLGFAFLFFVTFPSSALAEETDDDATYAVLVINHHSFAKSRLVTGSIQTLTGVFFGSMTEYVYEKNESHELSRLNWQEHFVPYIGIKPQLNIGGFFINALLLSAIPVKSGIISGTVRDYDYEQLPDTELTNFSQHDALTEKHFELSPSLGWEFKIGKVFSFSPFAGFVYRNRKWNAANGYLQYPDDDEAWNADIPKEYLSGTIITYEESTWFPSAGLKLDFNIKGIFYIALKGAYYPYLNVETTDTHVLTWTAYYDKMSGGWGASGAITLSYKPFLYRGLVFSLEAGYEGLFPPEGSTMTGNVGDDEGRTALTTAQPKMESNLWWINLGIILFPSELLR